MTDSRVRPSAKTPSPKLFTVASLPAHEPFSTSTSSTWSHRAGIRPLHPTKAGDHRSPLNSEWYLAATLPPQHPPWQAQHIPQGIRTWHHATDRRKAHENQLQRSGLSWKWGKMLMFQKKKNGSGKGSALLIRSKTGLFKGKGSASTSTCNLLEDRL